MQRIEAIGSRPESSLDLFESLELALTTHIVKVLVSKEESCDAKISDFTCETLRQFTHLQQKI